MHTTKTIMMLMCVYILCNIWQYNTSEISSDAPCMPSTLLIKN